jgi:hypothetical protein
MAHPGPAYLVALVETLVVEVPVYAVSFRWARLLAVRPAVAVAVLANLLTHPVVWLVLIHGGPSGYRFGLAEIGAVLVEAVVCWLFVRRDPALIVLVALVANTASVLVGSGVGQIVGRGR